MIKYAEETEEFKRELLDADMVLVGLGKFLEDEVESHDQNRFGDKFQLNELIGRKEAGIALHDENFYWLNPILGHGIVRSYVRDEAGGEKAIGRTAGEERAFAALERLAGILGKKNYFVLSEMQNPLVREVSWREGRIVMPWGCFDKKQCGNTCEDSEIMALTKTEREGLDEEAGKFWTKIRRIMKEDANKVETDKAMGKVGNNEVLNMGKNNADLPEDVAFALKMLMKREKIHEEARKFGEAAKNLLGTCRHCGAAMELNVVECDKFDSRGHKKEWEFYGKWLYGSMNRKLLLLDLGGQIGRNGLIEEPFRKLLELHKNVKIHTIKENIIDWLENL